MNRFDEKKYVKLLEQIPEASTQLELSKAHQQIKKEKQRRKLVFKTLLTATILCFAFIGMIRYSSTFAYAVAQLPGMKPLVEMIALDKGMKDIVENDYYEEMNVSQTIDGNTLTITGVVADESGMIIYYKLKSVTDLAEVQGSPKTELLQDGKPMEDVSVGASWFAQSEGTFEVENTIEVTASVPIDYSSRQFELHFSTANNPESVFEIPFTLENEVKQSKHIAINEELTMDGQKITVHELILSPIRSQLVLSIDPNNTMDILHFGNIQLYDEKGEQWGKIKNGVVGIGAVEDEKFSLMLESNYFRLPKSFDIVFEEVEAILEKDAYVTIDWETKQVLSQPSMLDVELQVKSGYEIEYTLPLYKKQEFKGVFDRMIDAEGHVYRSNSTWVSSDEHEQRIGQFYDVETPPVNPVRLKVTRYEHYLKEKGKVKVEIE